MNQFKLLSGAAVACAACCAIPIGGAFVATAFASSTVAVFNEATVTAGVLMVAVVAASAGLAFWRRRQLAKAPATECGCPQEAAPRDAPCGPTSCGVKP